MIKGTVKNLIYATEQEPGIAPYRIDVVRTQTDIPVFGILTAVTLHGLNLGSLPGAPYRVSFNLGRLPCHIDINLHRVHIDRKGLGIVEIIVTQALPSDSRIISVFVNVNQSGQITSCRLSCTEI